jgi:hypothetical protein
MLIAHPFRKPRARSGPALSSACIKGSLRSALGDERRNGRKLDLVLGAAEARGRRVFGCGVVSQVLGTFSLEGLEPPASVRSTIVLAIFAVE